MLVSEIATRVYREFGDDAKVQIDDNDIIRWINDAQIFLADDHELFKTKSVTDVVANQYIYPLPSNVYMFHSVRYNGVVLNHLSEQESEQYIALPPQTYPTGTPAYFWVWSGSLYLYPSPTTAITQGITFFYKRAPVPVATTTDTPEVPEKYHPKLVDFCLLRAYRLDDNLYGYQVAKAGLDTALQSMKDDQNWDTRNYYPMIQSPEEDASYLDPYSYGTGY